MDPRTGKAGARRVSFEIPQHAANSPLLSDMTLVRRIEAVHENDDDSLDPMRYDKGRVLANVSGQLPANAKPVSLFFVVHPDANSNDQLTLDIQAIHEVTPCRRMPLPLLPMSQLV